MSTRAERKAKPVELCQQCKQPRKNNKEHTKFRVFCCLSCKETYKHNRDLEIRERIRLAKVKEKEQNIAFGIQEPEVELVNKDLFENYFALKFIDFSKKFKTSAEKTTVNALAKGAISRYAREFKIDYKLINQIVDVIEKDPITGAVKPGKRKYDLFSITPKSMYEIFYVVRARYIQHTSYTHKQSLDTVRSLYNIFIEHINEQSQIK